MEMTISKVLLKSTWLAGLVVFLSASQGLRAQCPTANRGDIINSAFRTGLSRDPYTSQAAANARGANGLYLPSANGECDPGRYAGGSFSSTTDLIPLVKASQVCQDPWMAQGYYKLGLQINGHDPTVMEGGRPGSTQNQCNIRTYILPNGAQDGWSNFPGLLDAIRRHLSPTAAAVPPQAVSRVSLSAPSSVQSGKPVTISWSPALPTRCSDGVRLQFAGGIFGNDYNFVNRVPNTSNSYTFNAPTITSPAQVTMTLIDRCSNAPVSNGVSMQITTIGVTITVQGRPVTINPSGRLLTPSGQLWAADGTLVQDPAHVYYLDRNLNLKVANLVNTNGGNIVAAGGGNIVAAGGGNIVAAGGGNIVAAGGGNIVAAGGGNVVGNGGSGVVLQVAPDRTVAKVQGGYVIDSLGQYILQAGSNVTLKGSVLIGNNGLPLITSDLGGLVSDSGGTFKTVSQAQLQQALGGIMSNGAGDLKSGALPGSAANLKLGTLDPGKISAGQMPGNGPQISGGQFPGGGAQISGGQLPGGGPQIIAIDPQRLLTDANRTPMRSLQSVSNFTVPVFNASSGTWANQSAETFSWTCNGNPGASKVIVEVVVGNKSYDVCSSTPASNNRCQSQPVNWGLSFQGSLGGAVSLVDASSRKVLARTQITVRGK